MPKGLSVDGPWTLTPCLFLFCLLPPALALQIMRDEVGVSKGFGFVQYDSFESSDMAIECMNGQFLCNQPIVVQYAFKKESKGERHGSNAGAPVVL